MMFLTVCIRGYDLPVSIWVDLFNMIPQKLLPGIKALSFAGFVAIYYFYQRNALRLFFKGRKPKQWLLKFYAFGLGLLAILFIISWAFPHGTGIYAAVSKMLFSPLAMIIYFLFVELSSDKDEHSHQS